MASSDTHLEKALVEFNNRVNALEDEGPSVELVDLLVKRARVLAAMDFATSSREDLDDALEMMDELKESGVKVPADICFRTYVTLSSACEDSDEDMHRYLVDATAYLDMLEDPCFAARACVDCASDLIDLDDPVTARKYLKTALVLRGTSDMSQKNVLMNALFLIAEIHVSAKNNSEAIPYLVEAVGIGADLYEANAVRDMLTLLLSYVYLADALIDKGMKDDARLNLDAVSSILEDKSATASIDSSVIGDLHGQIGRGYVEIGEVALAEKHLLRQAASSLSGDDGVLRDAIERRMTDE